MSHKRGRPLGLASTGKKAFVPNSCSNQVDSLPPRVGFCSTNSNLSFRLLIPDRFRCATSHNEAVRSVTHLVLAHKLSRSFSVLSLSLFFILRASGSLSFLVFLAIDSAPIPPQAGPENFQCRATFIQFQRAVVPWKRLVFRGPTRF